MLGNFIPKLTFSAVRFQPHEPYKMNTKFMQFQILVLRHVEIGTYKPDTRLYANSNVSAVTQKYVNLQTGYKVYAISNVSAVTRRNRYVLTRHKVMCNFKR